MKAYEQMSKEELFEEKNRLLEEYKGYENAGLQLNMARGKPESAQLDLSMPMMDMINEEMGYRASDGTDCRNYGELDGIPEAKQFMAEIMECRPDQIIVFCPGE